jgi:hypothetical protein
LTAKIINKKKPVGKTTAAEPIKDYSTEKVPQSGKIVANRWIQELAR